MKYTKGPWTIKLCGYEKFSINGENGVEVCGTWNRANAILISAAPELLEALEPFAKLAHLFDDGVRGGTMPKTGVIMSWPRLDSNGDLVDNDITVEHLHAARAATHRARGES